MNIKRNPPTRSIRYWPFFKPNTNLPLRSAMQLPQNWLFLVGSVFFMVANPAAANITGKVFHDYNNNGTQQTSGSTIEVGLYGVTVSAYAQNASTALATATSAADGSYTLTGLTAATKYRIEFSWPTSLSWLRSSAAGGTTVQFATDGATGLNLAVKYPAEYVSNPTNPKMYIPQYFNGDPQNTTDTDPSSAVVTVNNQNTLLAIPWQASGRITTLNTVNLATVGQVGSIYGVAYSRQAKKVFTSAFLKRHTGLGPADGTFNNAPSAIYITDPNSGSTNATYFTSLQALGYPAHNATGSPAYGSGTSYTLTGTAPAETVTYPTGGLGIVGTNSERGLGALSAPSNDPATFGQVGKVSLGDLEMSDDGEDLFVANLYDRKIYKLPVDNATNPTTAGTPSAYTLPNPPLRNTLGGGYGTTYAGDTSAFYDGTKGVLRPFGLKYYHGKLYVGAVTTGEGANPITGTCPATMDSIRPCTNTDNNTGNPEYTDLWAYVFELDLTTGQWSSTPKLQFPLNYYRGTDSDNVDETWRLWTDKVVLQSSRFQNPQPMLASIEFDVDGSMILGFRDRTGDQAGNKNYALSATTTYNGYGYGDILRAHFDPAAQSFTLESNGTAGGVTPASGAANVPSESPSSGAGRGGYGPDGRAYYFEDSLYQAPITDKNTNRWNPYHFNTGMGAQAVLPGSGQVTGPYMDAYSTYEGGISNMDNTTALNTMDMTVYSTGSNGVSTFGKAAGLGDLELFFDTPPIEIGNRVWDDADDDGIQDAEESPLSGVTVTLKNGSSTLGTAITDTNGNYYFSSATGTSTDSQKYGITGLTPDTSGYQLSISTSDAALGGRVATIADNDTTDNGDSRDSDGIVSGSTVVASFTTGDAGSNDHTYDFGFVTHYSVGDLVFWDNNNNGLKDSVELGIEGVIVQLQIWNGSTWQPASYANSGGLIPNQTTDNTGYYLFTNVPMNPVGKNYRVKVLPSNFTASSTRTGVLYGALSSKLQSNDFTDDGNSLDHGIGTQPNASNGILSYGFDLHNLPSNVNLLPTVDFGYLKKAITTPPDLVLSKAANVSTVEAGSQGVLRYTLSASNRLGAGQLTKSPVISDTLPTGLTISGTASSFNSTDNKWKCTVNSARTQLVCSYIGGGFPLAGGTSLGQVAFTVNAAPGLSNGATLTNTAIISKFAGEPNFTNNTDSVSVTVAIAP